MTSQSDTEALMALVAHRIPAALKRITDGHGLMRVPAEDTDPDLVLADCKIALERMLASQTRDMVLVPREPTEEMLEAGSAVKAKFSFRETRIDVYKAMLSAAPVASQMGEPEALWHWVCNNQSDFGQAMDFLDGCRPLNPEITPLEIIVRRYAAPAAGMDVDWIKACAKEIQEEFYLGGNQTGPEWNGCTQKVAAIIRKHNG